MAKPQILTLQDIHYALDTDLIIASTTNGSMSGGYKKLTYNPASGYFRGWTNHTAPDFAVEGKRNAISRYNEL